MSHQSDSSESASNGKKQNEAKRLSFPFEIHPVNTEVNEQLLKNFTGVEVGFVQVGPKNYLLPSGYNRDAENLYNFPLRADDVFVTGISRSGTTWMQEMLWLLCNNLDYQKAAAIPLTQRFPFLEFSCFVNEEIKSKSLEENEEDAVKYKTLQKPYIPDWKSLSESKERRFIKTHLPFSLLPPTLTKFGCKVIYLARNPRDVAVSRYHLSRSLRTQGYSGDFPTYWYFFQNNLVYFTPYWEHIKEAWKLRHEPNVLFIFYEDMNKNLRHSIEKVSAFLGKSYSSQQLDILENHLKFENFKNNKSVNGDLMRDLRMQQKNEEKFIRKGINGGWKDYFDKKLEESSNEWIEKNLRNTDIKYPV